MDKQLESVLVEYNLHEIKVEFKAVKSTGEVVHVATDLNRYGRLFGFTDVFGKAELELLGDEYLTHEEAVDGVEFTEATIVKYDFENSIEFDELMNVCNILPECFTREERIMVIDYMTCIACLKDKMTLSEIEDKLAYRNREALLDAIIEESMIDRQSTLYDFIDFERLTDALFRYGYTETTNGFIFCY